MFRRGKLFKPDSLEEQSTINNWFDERIKKLEYTYYICVAELTIVTPLVIAVALKLFGV
ncbi:MAG: hypothetical protein QXV17_06915 [Candidatus Micrarchaeaceae archaeon]